MSDKNNIIYCESINEICLKINTTYCKRTKCFFCKTQPDTSHQICIKRYKNLDEDGKCYSFQRTV